MPRSRLSSAPNEGAARVAVHRLRKRFRELFRDEISQTLAHDADVEDEMRHLAAALAVRVRKVRGRRNNALRPVTPL